MIVHERMLKKAYGYGIDVQKILPALDVYAEYLVSYNQKVNLTAITDTEGIEDRHFIDSLLLAQQPEMKGAVVDVGTGAGFPGIVVKLYCPRIQLTLMEPMGKRVDFLQSLCEKLEIEAEIVKERAEDAAHKQWRAMYDTAVARAVAPMPILLEYCLPLVRTGGAVIAMKGANVESEMQEARNVMKLLGAKFEKKLDFTLPDGSLRSLIFYRKISSTPAVYPRSSAKIAKGSL